MASSPPLHQQRDDDDERLPALFSKCLRQVPNVELCKTYINYVRKKNMVPDLNPERLQIARNEVKDAFEFVVNLVGMDKESGGIWMDYLGFVKSGEVSCLGLVVGWFESFLLCFWGRGEGGAGIGLDLDNDEEYTQHRVDV